MATNKIVRLTRSASSRLLQPVSRFLNPGVPPPPQSPSPSPTPDHKVHKLEENLQMPKEEEEEEEEEEGSGDFFNKNTGEIGGPRGPEPTRYGDWEQRGRCSDF